MSDQTTAYSGKFGDLGKRLCARAEVLEGERGSWDSFRQEVANYVLPRKAQITSKDGSPNTSRESALYDSTAVRANMVLANGQLSWMTPMESRWFAYDPPAYLSGDDDIKQWYKRCTEIAEIELARCNFYTAIHEMYIDRGAFGTSVLMAMEGKREKLNFRVLPCGSYSLAEDDEGYVDTLFRKYEMTARQAAAQFGEERLSKDIRDCLKEEKKMDQKFWFIHAIYPRADHERKRNKIDGENKPIASVYMEEKAKNIVSVGGFDEQNFFATRYLMNAGHDVYGTSPSWEALPEARQLNFLERQMDALAEIAAFPRVLIPSMYKGDVDLRASGITYFDDQNGPNSVPREWATGGRYDIGKDRAEVKRMAIEEAFHVPLFQMFSQLDKQMTAREVAERSSEKLIQFSPTFGRMTTELFNPLLQRVFLLLLRGGALPPPPQSLVATGFIETPEIAYSSRVALAIKSVQNASMARTLELVMPLFQIRPDIADNYDFDRITRDGARNDGLPAEWMMDEERVQEMRDQRAAAQQQQMEMEQQAAAADAIGKVAKVPADSPLIQLAQQAA